MSPRAKESPNPKSPGRGHGRRHLRGRVQSRSKLEKHAPAQAYPLVREIHTRALTTSLQRMGKDCSTRVAKLERSRPADRLSASDRVATRPTVCRPEMLPAWRKRARVEPGFLRKPARARGAACPWGGARASLGENPRLAVRADSHGLAAALAELRVAVVLLAAAGAELGGGGALVLSVGAGLRGR